MRSRWVHCRKIVGVTILFLALVSCSPRPGSSAGSKGTENSAALPVPDFELPSLEGTTLRLSTLLDKPVVIDFWASWCPPCRRAIPDLVALHKRYGDQIVFLGVAVNDRREDIERARTELGITYPILMGTHEVARAYGIEGIPTLYLIDTHGKVAFRETGFNPDSGLKGLERVLKKYLTR